MSIPLPPDPFELAPDDLIVRIDPDFLKQTFGDWLHELMRAMPATKVTAELLADGMTSAMQLQVVLATLTEAEMRYVLTMLLVARYRHRLSPEEFEAWSGAKPAAG